MKARVGTIMAKDAAKAWLVHSKTKNDPEDESEVPGWQQKGRRGGQLKPAARYLPHRVHCHRKSAHTERRRDASRSCR